MDRSRRGFRFMPDAPNLATINLADSSIQLWNGRTGRLFRRIELKDFDIQGFALSADDKLAAVAGLNRPVTDRQVTPIRMFDPATGKELRAAEFRDRVGAEIWLAFTPDNKTLLAFRNTGSFKAFDVASGNEIVNRVFPRDSDSACSLSADGSLLAVVSGQNPKKVFLWHWQTQKEPRELAIDERVARIALSPDGKMLVTTYYTGSENASTGYQGRSLERNLDDVAARLGTTGDQYSEL